MDVPQLNAEQLLADWLRDYVKELPTGRGILTVQRAEPLPGYHNFFDRFKLRTAQFDGSGRNPTDINCIVLSVSETDQKAKLDPGTPCSSIGDLQ